MQALPNHFLEDNEMPVSSRNTETQRLARKLSAQTGETPADAIIVSLRERLERTRPLPAGPKGSPKIIARRSPRLAVLQVCVEGKYDREGLPR